MLSELLPAGKIRTPLNGRDKGALLRELVALAIPEADAATMSGVLAAVEAREAEISTAMGGGLAVPHGRTALVSDVRMAAGLVTDVPDFEGLDGAPVQVAFLVLTPPQEGGRHVKLLARIARLMHGPATRAALLSARSSDEFHRVLRDTEAA